MSSENNLDLIFENFKFSKEEKDGFNEAVQVAKNYLRNGDIDMEKQFYDIVEKVVKNEI